MMIIDVGDEELRDYLAPWLKDERISIIPRRGRLLAGALNTGMQAAQTPFTAILLGDDMWALNAIEVLEAHILSYPRVDFFHTARQFIDENDNLISSVYPATESFKIEDFVTKGQVKHLLCWRRELGLAIGGMDETIKNVGPDDYDFPWTMAEHGAIFKAIQDPLYLMRDHRESYRLTTHVPLNIHIQELRKIMRKHNVSENMIRKRIRHARRGYLKQCLYKNEFDRLLKEFFRYSPKRGWREKLK
jgi:hypothetical protein